jgi:pimeloyl-ACP methyl ester carboxylesterase
MTDPIKKGLRYWTAKIARVLLLLLFGLIVLGLLGMEGFDRYVSSERGTRWLYKATPEKVAIRFTDSGLRYLEIGDPQKPPLLLLHGSPGSVMDWRSLARDPAVYNQYRLLIAERPGYGGSKPRGAEPSVVRQAERCLEVLAGEGQPAVVAGYSYGAPVGLAMAGLAPDRIRRFVGIAGQYNPDDEMTLPISYVIRFGVFKYILPRWLWVSNTEKLGHPDALREALPLFDQVSIPVDLIHGLPDAIVPYGNSPWLSERLRGLADEGLVGADDEPGVGRETVRLYTVQEIGHEMPFSSMDTIVRFVLDPEPFFRRRALSD